MQSSPDIVIIGSGMGGSTLAAGLAPTGARIIILERGHRIPDDAPARDPNRIFRNSAFLSDETWIDEEGSRFPATLTGSSAVAGRFDPACLESQDEAGISLGEALLAFGGDPAGAAAVGRARAQVHAYVELHIEQGPVLEAEGLPVLRPFINASVKVRESHERHRPLVYLAPSHKVTGQFRELYRTLVDQQAA